MNEHQTELLGAYALGVLDGEEWASVQSHLAGCAYCRREVEDLQEMEAALGEIPPEAFLDGPPPNGDLLLHRTLVQVRGERGRRDFRRRALWTAAAVVAVIAAVAGGALVGRTTVPGTTPPAAVAGARTGSATDAGTGTAMTVALQPAAGWVRLHATVAGAPPGEQCRLYVVARDGSRREAGSWLVPATGETTLDGSALTPPADVTSVDVETFAGRILVSVPV